MTTHYFNAGDPVSYHGRTGVIDYYDNRIAVIKFIDGDAISISHAGLAEAYKGGEVTLTRRSPYNPFHIKLDDNQKSDVARLEAYCGELHGEAKPCAKGVRERVIAKVANKIGDTNPPSKSHLHRTYKKWIGNGKNMASVLFGGQRQRSPVISEEVFDLMDEAVKTGYLKRSKPTIARAYEAFVAAYRAAQYLAPCPSLSSFERRIKKLNRLKLINGRYGENAAREEGRTATAKTRLRHILELVSMDAAHFNYGLKNMRGDYVGMPSVYFVMDDYSRAILGYGIHVGKHSESTACVIHTLRYAISKKLDPLYPFYGVPCTVLVDQGVAYVSEDAVRFFGGLQVNIARSATRMGWGKPMIERFIGTTRTGFFCGLTGYFGKRDTKIRNEESIKKAAVHTVAEFRQAFSEFIINYHNTPHGGLDGKTPAQVWAESAKSYPPMMLEDISHGQLLRGIREEKTLKHVTGITCDYQTFNSNELQRLYHELQPSKKPGVRSEIKVTTYRDPLDATAISVVNPITNSVFEVPNIIGDEANNLSFAELRSTRKARTTAQAAPVIDGGVREGYSSAKRRKGPDVPLDDFDNPIDLNLLLATPSKPIASSSAGFENRPQTDEDDDYVVTID